MNFGSLESGTAWRLSRAGVTCHGIVVHGPGGFRLVVVEDQQIVEWIRVPTLAALWEQVTRAVRSRRQSGWRADPSCPGLITSSARLSRRHDPRPRHRLFPAGEEM